MYTLKCWWLIELTIYSYAYIFFFSFNQRVFLWLKASTSYTLAAFNTCCLLFAWIWRNGWTIAVLSTYVTHSLLCLCLCHCIVLTTWKCKFQSLAIHRYKWFGTEAHRIDHFSIEYQCILRSVAYTKHFLSNRYEWNKKMNKTMKEITHRRRKYKKKKI